MPPRHQERRKNQRYALDLPIIVSGRGMRPDLEGMTRDASASGVFFYTTDWPLSEMTIEFRIVFPAQLTLSESMGASCKGTVVRIERPATEGRIGIAATIDEFQWA